MHRTTFVFSSFLYINASNDNKSRLEKFDKIDGGSGRVGTGLLVLILNIVMQAQLISDREPVIYHINRRLIPKEDFPTAAKTRKENRIMIIKSFSSNHNQSLCVKSLFRKTEHSSTSKTKTRSKLFVEQLIVEGRTNEVKQTCVGNLNDCEKQLRHFRNLQKSDIFFKINEMEKKISREIRRAKNRQNKRYMTQAKPNKMKSKLNSNSLHLSDIPAAIKIKHIENQNLPPEVSPKSIKFKTSSSFHQNRLISIINQRFFRELDAKSISISNLNMSKLTKCQKKEKEEFTGWTTVEDYDF